MQLSIELYDLAAGIWFQLLKMFLPIFHNLFFFFPLSIFLLIIEDCQIFTLTDVITQAVFV